MKIIAIGAVTAGGKTTLVNAIKDKLTRTASLHFDDYLFDGEVNDFINGYQTVLVRIIMYGIYLR